MRSKLNAHMGDPQHGFAEGESGFEGIFHDKTQDGMYVVREAVDISGASAASLRHRRDGGGSFTPSTRRPIVTPRRRVRRRHEPEAPRITARDGSPEVPRHRHADFAAAARLG